MMSLHVYTLIAFMLFANASGFNHWLVTEDGKIQYQAASPFNLKQPFNLLAFMQQEDRVTLLRDLKDELIGYKEELEGRETLDEFGASFQRGDPTCRMATPLSSFDLFVSTVLPLEHKGIHTDQLLATSHVKSPGEPVCSSPLDFTMYGLEHLEGVAGRRSLQAPPEGSVLPSGAPRMDVFASTVHHALEKNATSWVLLELATLYWRARGNPYQAIECIRRALHYTPEYARDIPLLHLANILHRSGRSEQAVVPLLVATGISPDVNILHFMLGNVFAVMGQWNDSMASLQRSLELSAGEEVVMAMYTTVQCQVMMERAFVEHARRLEVTRRKLHEFYETLHTLRLSRVTGGREEMEDDLEGLLDKLNQFVLKEEGHTHQSPLGHTHQSPLGQHTSSMYSQQQEREGHPVNTEGEGHEEREGLGMLGQSNSSGIRSNSPSGHSLRDVASPEETGGGENFTTLSDGVHLNGTAVGGQPNATAGEQTNRNAAVPSAQTTSAERHEAPPMSRVVLEEALEDAVINLSHDLVEEGRGGSRDLMEGRGGSRDLMEEGRGMSRDLVEEGVACSDVISVKKNTPPRIILRVLDQSHVKDTPPYHVQDTPPSHEEVSKDPTLPAEVGSAPPSKQSATPTQGGTSQSVDVSAPPTDPSSPGGAPPTNPHGYSEAYRSIEFLPYHPLPSELEELMFPHLTSPLHPIDDPFWPTKAECLDLIGSDHNWPQFTGIFLTPEARGVSLQALFSAVARDIPAILLQKPPRCTDIVELPFSMSAMDHLVGVANRTSLRGGEGAGERGLMQVLRVAVSASLGVELSFEESAERVYAAMMKHGPHWALFNMASLYWRVSGDPQNTVECLRRAIHFAPAEAKDVGYIGLASVLHRYGYLSDAVVVARAALDITGGTSVGHYLLASIYLTLGELLATSLHLRMALHIQPQFDHAFSTLRLIRCSLKFKEERKYLQQKQRELLQSQGQDISSQDGSFSQEGSPLDPPLGTVFTAPGGGTPEPLVPTPFTGESTVRYLTRLALIQRSKEQGVGEKGEKGPLGTQNGPLGTQNGPLGTQNGPLGTQNGPLETQNGPLETQNGPLGTQNGPLETQNGPLETQNEPLGTQNGPLGTQNGPLETQNGPLGTQNGPLETQNGPLETQNEPLGTQNGPLGTQNGPLGTQNGPLETQNGPLGTQNGPLGTQNGPLGTQNGPLETQNGPLGTQNGPLGTQNGPLGTHMDASSDVMAYREHEIRPKERTSKKKKKKDGATPLASKDTPPITKDTPQEHKDEENSQTPPTAPPPPDPPVRHGPKTRDEVLEERRRKQFPGQRAWPTLEDCTQTPPPRHILFTSTWLSVSAKGANVKEYVDLKSDVGNVTNLPHCDANFETSKRTLDYLAGMESPPLTEYKAERGLQEVLCKIDGTYRSLDDMATRLHRALAMNSTSWVVTNLAALYWRVVGQGPPAVQCLKNALHYGPDNMRDVAYVSLANVLYRTGYEQDAAVVMQLSLEASPTLVVNHFTMANVLAAQGYLREAAGFYESTLHYQPEFEPAAERLRIARCLVVMSKAQSERNSNHGNGTNATNSTRGPSQP